MKTIDVTCYALSAAILMLNCSQSHAVDQPVLPPINLKVVNGPVVTNPNCTKDVWHNLENCGWPGPKNTGYPAGISLTSTQSRTITVDNTVIDGEKIVGGLIIDAKNVVIRNSWITSSFGLGEAVNATAVVKVVPGASATIEHCTLDGSNRTHAGIWNEGTNLIASNNNIFGINDGIFIWGTENFDLEDNYLHNFTEATANGHVDGFQTEGGGHGIVRHNVFDITQDVNAAVAIWDTLRNTTDILVENNLAAGSGFLMYAEDNSNSGGGVSGGYKVTNIRHVNNKFSTVHYGCAGYWGVWYPRAEPNDGWHRNGNVILETGVSVDNGNPSFNGNPCN